MRLHCSIPIDIPFRKTVEHLVECDTSLEARQCGTEAKMDPVTETQMSNPGPIDVEAVRISKVALVPIGRPVQEHHDAVFGHDLAVVLDIASDPAGLDR